MCDGTAPTHSDDERFDHQVRVRYGDCDMQGVVFNATYLAYVDDALDVWLQHRLGPDYLTRFDYMVKKAAIEWSDAAIPRDLLTLRPHPIRWGTTSFNVSVTLETDRGHIAEATLTLISVRPGHHTPVAVPDDVRQALGPTTAAEV